MRLVFGLRQETNEMERNVIETSSSHRDETGPVILVSPSESHMECNDISPDECLKKLQTFLKLTSLPFTSEKSELDRLCSDVALGYNCSTKKITLPHCLTAKDKGTFPVLRDMAQYTAFMFCASGDNQHGYLRKILLENSDCIKKQKKALDCCAEQSKLSDLPIMHILEDSGRSLAERQISACCPISIFLKCVRTIVHDNCGEVAGNFTIEYVRRSSGEELEEVCQKMPNYPDLDQGICKADVPTCAGNRNGIFAELTVLMSVLFLMWLH